ncbi:MAG: isoprenylcysteine carboxylmethyltransferase family protein [Chloroflexi bacterium]|nr:isoprenylcysteine carboxylmethyltransferase family protein [Chloroflexota bacterium]
MDGKSRSGILRQIAAILALPFVVTIIVPTLLIGRDFNIGWGLSFPFNLLPIGLGIALLCGGLWLFVMTIRLFFNVGQGTLAPWDPTRHLVVVGVYRYVRNPMISGVFSILLGKAILFGSLPVLIWALVFMAVNMIYMPLIEEPGLRDRFGAEYDEYVRHVPRWLPRRRPWTHDGIS